MAGKDDFVSITERIDAVTKIPKEYRSVTPPVPRSVKIEVTAVCDFRCFFCATGQRLRKVSHMDLAFYKRIVREMRDVGVEELGVFYLGESFTCSWLPEAIRFAKKECGYPYVFLTTNGRLATSDRVEECIRAGLDSLKFSFNFADADQFAEVTRVKSEWFHDVVQHIRDARRVRDAVEKETGHRCGIYASSIKYNDDQLERMKKAARDILPYVDEHYWLPLYNQAALTTEQIEDYGFMPTAGNQGRIGALRQPLPCWSVFTEGHISFDGHVAACCFDHNDSFNMGDLNEMSFMEAWHSEAFQALRRANLECDVAGTACEFCVAW